MSGVAWEDPVHQRSKSVSRRTLPLPLRLLVPEHPGLLTVEHRLEIEVLRSSLNYTKHFLATSLEREPVDEEEASMIRVFDFNALGTLLNIRVNGVLDSKDKVDRFEAFVERLKAAREGIQG